MIVSIGNFGVILAAILLSTSLHYFFLRHLNDGGWLATRYPHLRLGYGVLVALIAHSIEVTLFAIAYLVSIRLGFGTLEGEFTGTVADYVYFSYAAFTTVGFGDIVPKTTGGQFISAILILVGYSLIIVPTGFVSAEVLDRKRRRVISTVSCPSCLTEDHDDDALFCKYCGGEM